LQDVGIDKEFDLVVFPEACFESGEYGKWNAEEHRKFIENARQCARDLKRYLCITLSTPKNDDNLKKGWNNSAHVFDPDGNLVAKHDKFDLCHGDEQKAYDFGEDPQCAMFEIDGVKLGVIICIDLYDVRVIRATYKSDIDVLLAPVYCGQGTKGVSLEEWRESASNQAATVYGQNFANLYSAKHLKKEFLSYRPKGELTMMVIDPPYGSIASGEDNRCSGITCAWQIRKGKVCKIERPNTEKSNLFFVDVDVRGNIVSTSTEQLN